MTRFGRWSMSVIAVLVTIEGGCASLTINAVRETSLAQDGEAWRYAYFDAATRVLAKRGYTIKISDRPSIVSTTWKGEWHLVGGDDGAILSFRLQFTTTNQAIRLQADVNQCITGATSYQVPCTDELAPYGIDKWPADSARAIDAYMTDVQGSIVKEARSIYSDLSKRPVSLSAVPFTPSAECKDVADCIIRCKSNNGRACARAGAMFEGGLGVPPDPARAAEFYKRACVAGDSSTCANLPNRVQP